MGEQDRECTGRAQGPGDKGRVRGRAQARRSLNLSPATATGCHSFVICLSAVPVDSPWHTGSVTPSTLGKSDSGGTPSITTLSSREVYRNPWMRVREDEILRSNGKRGIYGVVEKDEAAIILPIDGDRIWLVEQFRYTIQQRAVELPQGGWEMAIDDPEELARGELKEETGLLAERMTWLGAHWIAYGFTRQKQHVFLASGLAQA